MIVQFKPEEIDLILDEHILDEHSDVNFSTREGIMREWDKWRGYEGGGSWPRDAFESLLDYLEEQYNEELRSVKRLNELLNKDMEALTELIPDDWEIPARGNE